MGRRSDDRDADPELRAWLLKDRKAFRRQMCSTLAENPDWASKAWEQLSRSVSRLADGEEYRLHGWELPDEHPANALGVQLDWVLGADDVLRAVD